MVAQELVAKLLIAAQEHPRLHGDHSRITLVIAQSKTAIDETGAEVPVRLGEVVFDPFAVPLAQAGATHVRRICHDYVVALRQGQQLRLQLLQLIGRGRSE